jgi:hypothetical protein
MKEGDDEGLSKRSRVCSVPKETGVFDGEESGRGVKKPFD